MCKCIDCISYQNCSQKEKNRMMGGGICDNFLETEFFMDQNEDREYYWWEMSYYRYTQNILNIK